MMYEKSKTIFSQVPKVLYENRYCNQEGFSILICGGKDKKGKITNQVLELKIPSFEMKKFPSMVKPHCYLKLVNIKSDILAIGNRTKLNKSLEDSVVFTEIYSGKAKIWNHQYTKSEEKSSYCVGSFMYNCI